MQARPFPPARPHGDLREIVPDVFLLTGSFAAGPMRFSRNMVVVRHGERLVLINTVRLDDAGLATLDALGRVTDIVRIGGFHGSDDPFYKERYGCTVHAVRGQTYFEGIDPAKGAIYFQADVALDRESPLPIPGASLYVIGTTPPEAILRLPHDGGILVSADSLHNWMPDRYFNLFGRVVMRLMGFLGPHRLGPGWIKNLKPDPAEIVGILDLEFTHVLPGHGAAVIGDGPRAYRPAIDAYVRSAKGR